MVDSYFYQILTNVSSQFRGNRNDNDANFITLCKMFFSDFKLAVPCAPLFLPSVLVFLKRLFLSHWWEFSGRRFGNEMQ
jgi:hypothetical protein